MFKNLLVPTDGSSVSRKAAKRAAALAKATGATITGFHVAPSYRFEVYTDYVPRNFMFPDAYAEKAKQVAERHLGFIRKIADAAGVKFAGRYALSDNAADAIVDAARKYRCDGIVMGSHGRSGLNRLLIGSETQKVLVGAKVPVVVIR